MSFQRCKQEVSGLPRQRVHCAAVLDAGPRGRSWGAIWCRCTVHNTNLWCICKHARCWINITKYWIWQTIHQIYTKPIVFGTLCLAIAPRYKCLGSLGFYLAGLVPPGHTATYPTLGCWAQHRITGSVPSTLRCNLHNFKLLLRAMMQYTAEC